MDSMYKENLDLVIGLMDVEGNVWGIKLSLLRFVYEYFMYDVVVYICF